MHLSVCICTYRRPEWLRRLLKDVSEQDTHGQFTFEIVVADNDPSETGSPVVAELKPSLKVPIIYAAEPRRSISHVRNMTLAHATGDGIVFIDDDEFPSKDWLYNLFTTLKKFDVAGVLGPVRPHFEVKPPQWIVKGRFCERPEHETGYLMPWSECRTGNVLFRREIIKGVSPVFLPEFGTAGSDVNFFWRMIQNGCTFVWCNEAAVYEVVPPARWKRSFMLKRALLRGGNFLQHPEGRIQSIATSLLAVPIYTLMLPVLLVAGHHHFMRYLVKWCDHSARLLGIFGVKLIKQRPM